MLFMAVPWCGLGMVRFQLAMVGFMWGWLVVDGHKAIRRSKTFFLLRPMNLVFFLRDALIDWVLVLD